MNKLVVCVSSCLQFVSFHCGWARTFELQTWVWPGSQGVQKPAAGAGRHKPGHGWPEQRTTTIPRGQSTVPGECDSTSFVSLVASVCYNQSNVFVRANQEWYELHKSNVCVNLRSRRLMNHSFSCQDAMNEYIKLKDTRKVRRITEF